MLQNLKHDVRQIAGNHKWLHPIFSIKKNNRDLLIKNDTDIVIEGYPRSANTYSVVAFQQAQKKQYNIAHHLHIPTQVLIAVDREIPVILLIREPIDAIASLLVRHPDLDAKKCVRDYVAFYTKLIPVINNIVIADFEDVTKDFGSIISRVNDKYGVNFDKFITNEISRQQVFDRIQEIRKAANRSINQIAIPDKSKVLLKEEVKKTLINSGCDIEQATRVYARFI